MSWDTYNSVCNTALLAVAGVEVEYVCMNPPQGPVTVRVIENDAPPPERTSPGHFASISLRPSDLPAYPAEGDEVTLRGILFRVTDPDPADPNPGELREDWVTVGLHKKK